MKPRDYTADQLVEQPARGLFGELGWQTALAMEEVFGIPSPGLAATLSHPMGEGASLGRETPGEVVLVPRLRAALACDRSLRRNEQQRSPAALARGAH